MFKSLISTLRVTWVAGVFVLVSIVVHVAEMIAIFAAGAVPFPGYWTSTVTSVIITIGLVYGIYWVKSSDIPSHREPRIIGWFVSGMIVFLLINIGFMGSAPDASLFRLVTWVRWAVVFGGGIGFAIGIFETRSIVRELEAERGRVREKELQRERDRLDRVGSTISHDLRNPLNVIQGRIELAQEEFESEHLDIAARSAHWMEDLIDDILMLARSGEDIDEVQEIDFETLVDSCWEGVGTPEATLEIHVGRTIRGDRNRLRQAIENLIRNAVEHGGEDVTVTIGELDDGFYVEDDGPGIPEAKRETVFEMGYSESDTGTGFGLTIVKEIVQAHNWDIEIREGADGGARFEITGVEFVDSEKD